MQLAHALVLLAHSTLRWLILVLALLLIARTASGWRQVRHWQTRDERWHMAFVNSLRVQFVLGLLLYLVLSPVSGAFLASPETAIKVSDLRFFGLEHALLMAIAVAVADAARSRSKRLLDPQRRQRQVCLSSAFVLALILAAIPWPFMHAPRPLVRTWVSSEASLNSPAPTAGACPESYQARCAACHGANGAGDGVLASSLTPRPASFIDGPARHLDEQGLESIIREGGAAHGRSPIMPAHPDLSRAELKALVGCVRSFGGEVH